MIKIVGVRFRNAGKIYYFGPGNLDLTAGMHVIVETARGVELGTVMIPTREVNDDSVIQPLKPVIRIATEADEKTALKNREKEKEAFKICLEKIAKEQNLSLNPTKISGVCGRLMCCLKNEEETYEYLNSRLPNVGDYVTTDDGLKGEVSSVSVLRQMVKVLVEVDDEKEIRDYSVDQLKFKPKRRRDYVKLTAQELKELSALEDKGGKSKIDDAK